VNDVAHATIAARPIVQSPNAKDEFRERGTSWLTTLRRWRPVMASETLLLGFSAYLIGFCNGPFWHALLSGRAPGSPATVGFAVAVGTACTALTFVLLASVAQSRLIRPLLTVIALTTAAAVYYVSAYGVILDPSMLKNVLHTDYPEARQLVGSGLLFAQLKFAALPVAATWWVRLAPRSTGRAFALRLLCIAAAWLIAIAALLLVYRDFVSVMRNERDLRYLITPGNYVFSLARALSDDARHAAQARIRVGADARLAVAWQAQSRPVLFVIMVGETARADHFSLNGYERDTSPELSQLDIVNFPDVTSCGTATEVSLPCMFSQRGREQYDKGRIGREEGLLNVLATAGLGVLWRDNQSGCKGVCDGKGIEVQRLQHSQVPGPCGKDDCYDEVLLHELAASLRRDGQSQVVVLHMLGNHGPAYFSRYPHQFRRFTPTCDTGELRQCSREEVINSYDNALLYTDHVVAETIRFLQGQSRRFDTALLYVSDHGESLGEHGLYLHGMPYAIAPREQTHVPMIVWLSREFQASMRVDESCLRRVAQGPASHDNLFHSVLGLLDVQTGVYRADRDVFSKCRPESRVAAR
jgi:lipid A ethanolaminephosphotransferase